MQCINIYPLQRALTNWIVFQVDNSLRSNVSHNKRKTCSISIWFMSLQFNWRGELVYLPCKYSEYDYAGSGYFTPADLAYHIQERGREPDNMMVFRRLDQNGEFIV